MCMCSCDLGNQFFPKILPLIDGINKLFALSLSRQNRTAPVFNAQMTINQLDTKGKFVHQLIEDYPFVWLLQPLAFCPVRSTTTIGPNNNTKAHSLIALKWTILFLLHPTVHHPPPTPPTIIILGNIIWYFLCVVFVFFHYTESSCKKRGPSENAAQLLSHAKEAAGPWKHSISSWCFSVAIVEH